MVNRQTTGQGLLAEEAFLGLVDHGLFGDKIPQCFISRGLSEHIPKKFLCLITEEDDGKLKKFLDKRKHDFVRYEALRDVNVPRQMGIPHPESYIVQCLVLKRLWKQVKKHCSKPDIPVSRIFVRKMANESIFRMNYKGKDHLEIEEKNIENMMGANYIVHTDISTCFPSICTHSISWSLHGVNKVKKDRSPKLVGNLLDRVTRDTHDGQTNGLLIGPHTSNILSEIILTRVDYEMIKRGYSSLSQSIDDYTFYAETRQAAENFLRDLQIQLRRYDLALNARKTEILPMPRPNEKNWVRELREFPLFSKRKIPFEIVRSLLDLALKFSNEAGTSATLNYAIKMVPARLNERAKRLFVREVVNFTLIYPYLAPLLGEHVSHKHRFEGIDATIQEFVEKLLQIGIEKLYPDAIAYAFYYSLKYNLKFRGSDNKFQQIVEIDDCVSDVLLFEYVTRLRLPKIRTMIQNRANKLKDSEIREQDRFWLLIYQLWRAETLEGRGQTFLAHLKRNRFSFVNLPSFKEAG